MLQINSINVSYGDVSVLSDITMSVNQGELVAVIGSNGAGKTTLLKTISGLLRVQSGEIVFNNQLISVLKPHQIVSRGIVQVPEGRLLFPEMTIRENLDMGGYLIRKNKTKLLEQLEYIFTLFPILKERENQISKTMSGGEQQILAIARALMTSPKLIIFDEPSLGLAPKMVQNIFDIIMKINKDLGMAVLLVEQNVMQSCQISDRAYVLDNGKIILSGTGAEMLSNEHVKKAYLGL